MFSEYEDFLCQNFSINFWSDDGISTACEILNKFSDKDWSILAQSWGGKNSEWKVRCAETIDAHPSQLVMNVLLEMLEDNDIDVVVAAADSLRSFTQTQLNIQQTTLERIMKIRDRAGIAVKAVLSDFIKRTAT